MTRPTLLCVDDDAGVRELYRLLLGSHGYEVVVAENGSQAIQLFRSLAIHAVILDYEMPCLNGSEVAAEIKRRRPDVPVIMVSGCPSVVDEAPKFVDAAIAKGSSVGRLLDKLEMYVGMAGPRVRSRLPLSRLTPLGSALATVAVVGFLLARVW
jgi:CheY-like chemotaxis protein